MSGPLQAICPGEEELVELATGLLASDPARSGALHAHVDGCTPCGLLLADLLLAAGGDEAAASSEPEGERAAGPAPVRPGARLGRYLLLDELGRGGMGVVCAAFDPQLDRRVALKRVRPGAGEPREACARLLAEAQALARLSHPNVVTVYDAQLIPAGGGAEGAGDELFVAMELLPGRTLRDLMQGPGQGQVPSAKPPARALLARFLEAGEGLCAAHAAGLVHGDFKPENALLGEEGRVRVADFGLAREAGERLRGAVAGTPSYLAPEQWLGQAADARSDQFAFCVSLWEALAGARPFTGVTRDALLEQIARGPAAGAAARLSPRVRKLLLRGLAFDPAARHPTLRTLLDALARLPPELTARRPLSLVMGGAAGLAGTALLATVAWTGGLPTPSASRARPARAAQQVRQGPGGQESPPLALEVEQVVERVGDRAVEPVEAAPPLQPVIELHAEAVPEAALRPAPAPAAAPRAPQASALVQRRAPSARPAAAKVPADEESRLAAEAAGRAADGDPRGALALHRRLLALREQRYGPHALTAAHARLDLGLDLIALGDVEAGRAEVRSALASLSRGFFSREPEVFASELRALDGPSHPATPPLQAAPGRPAATPSGGHTFPEGHELPPGVRTVR